MIIFYIYDINNKYLIDINFSKWIYNNKEYIEKNIIMDYLLNNKNYIITVLDDINNNFNY